MDGSGTADRVDRVAVSPGVSTAGATQTREVDPLTVTQRLQREGRWKDIEPERNEMMKLARKTMSREGRGANSGFTPNWTACTRRRAILKTRHWRVTPHRPACQLQQPNPPMAGRIAGRFRGLVTCPRSGRSCRRTLPCRLRSPGFRRTGFGSWRNDQGLRRWCVWVGQCPLPPHGLRWAGLRPAS